MNKSNRNILSIKSSQIRNTLRGIIGNKDPFVTRKALERIKNKSGEESFKKAISVIRTNELFEDNGITREFNKKCPKGLLEVLNYNVEEITERINSNKKALEILIDNHICVLNSLYSLDYDDALRYCNKIIDQRGVSCYLLRCLFYIDNRVDGSEQYNSVSNNLSQIFDKISIGNSRYLENAIRELSSSKTDYFNIYKRISDSSNKLPFNIISKNFLSHVYKTDEDFFKTLNSYYSYSLFDALLYLISSNRFSTQEKYISEYIDSSLIEKLSQLSAIEVNLHPYSEATPEYDPDLSFFRECFLLIEQNDCYRYKTVHGAFFNENENKLIEITPIERKLIHEYFYDISTINDLKDNNNSAININKFNKNKCSILENSTALIYIIEKSDGDITDFDEAFIKAMNYTRDIGIICPNYYLERINSNTKNIDLKVVLACLISIKDKSQIAEHSLRRVLQEHCRTNFNSSLKELISTIYEVSPAVAEHLVQICDETFLTKLFQITENPNKAVVDRAEILEWYGTKINDNSFKERAKNLKIDVQISKEKGTIDDSRIYVDPLKFTQWINNNIINDLTLLLSATCGDDEISSVSINWDTVYSGLSNVDQISSSLLLCFNQFCTNNLFGIASYLGRRIRHGTFKGTGLKDLKELHIESRHYELFQDRDFSNYYREWLESYEEMLEELKTNNLHIKSKKKPNGLINANLNTNIKKAIANQMYIDVYNSFVRSGFNVEIPYLITEYCWRLAEEDLAGIRKFIMEKKSNHAVFKANNIIIKNIDNRLLRDFNKEINSTTTEKFRTITTWFNKPSIASPSTDLILLFKAVTSEVKGLFDGFSPRIECGTTDFPVNGGQYFVIYDALFVLIFNVAEYGLDNGLVKFNIELSKEEKHIKISIVSEVENEDALDIAESLINEALASDFLNAHVIEGRSGIKKLRQMEKDNYINSISYEYIKPNKISSSFNYTVDF